MIFSISSSLACRSILGFNICNSCFHSSPKQIHIYKNTIPWKNRAQLCDELIKSVVYYDNGLLVLNKPYGITFSRSGVNKEYVTSINPEDNVFKKSVKDTKKKFNGSYFSSGVVSDDLSLVDCLPYIKEHFKLNKLHIARVPEKYMSGVAILTTSQDMVEKVNKCRAHAPTGKDKYEAIVIGVPRYSEGIVKLGFNLIEDSKKGKRPILLHKWSNRAYKRNEVRIGTFHYKTRCYGYEKLTSLIEVGVELRKYHAYRMFCSDYLLSPVLGDNLFGSRVQTVMGLPMLIDPLSDIANSPQKLAGEIYELLELNSGEAPLIPLHVHLSEMMLPRFLEGKKTLLLKAPPPTHFQWSCEKLGLRQSEETTRTALST